MPFCPSRARWHFIGHLQKNKVPLALSLGVELFHGIDSLGLAREINRAASAAGGIAHVLLEVNVAGESTKFGFAPNTLQSELEDLLGLNRLSIEGLMCLPPLVPKAEDARKYFVTLRTLRDRIATDFKVPLPQLSMGMSGDYPVAVEEGATLVRVGSAIFGERTGKTWKPVAEATFDD
jgi:pyridoxal phosphate enzyme (YggS family)